jgi:Tol biopolymer transport system component
VRKVLAVLAVPALALTTAGGASMRVDDSAPPVVTLVRGGTIEAFAQDGNRIVWADSSQPRCQDVLRLRDLTTGKTVPLMAGAANLCNEMATLGGFQHRMALAGTRALWAYVGESNTEYHFYLYTGMPGQSAKPVASMDIGGGLEDPDYFTSVPLAGDGPTLVYVNQSSAEENYGYNYVWRIPGGRVPGSCATVQITANGDSFAAARSVSEDVGRNDVEGLSPDGRRLAYTSVPGGCYDPNSWRLYVADLDGNTRPIATGDWTASWAPDSRRLLIRSQGRVEIVDTDTGAQRVLASHAFDAWWSPDGTRVWVWHQTSSGVSDSDLIPAGGGPAHHLPGVDRGWWSPNGRLLAFTRKAGLYVAAADATHLRRLGAAAEQVAWTADSKSLIVSRGGLLDLVAADGSGVQRLTGRGFTEWGLSPDGKRLWYDSHAGLGLLDLGSKAVTTLGQGDYPQWSPDSTQLDWQVYDPTADKWRLKLLDTHTGTTTTIAEQTDLGSATWSPDSARLAFGSLGQERNQRLAIFTVSDGTTVTLPFDGYIDTWLPDSTSLLVTLQNRDESGDVSGEDLAVVGRDGSGLRQITLTPTTTVPAWTGVEIRRTSDGTILHSFPTTAVPLSIALTADRVALLFHQTVELRTFSGSLVQTFAVDPSVSEISMSGHWIVFRAGKSIQALDTSTGDIRTVAQAAGTVVGLSIDGHRVAWAEQLNGPNVIRAATLP